MNEAYIRTVQLLINVAPAVFETSAFAMKGGTALNLFVQDMPRLSVDIDVVFLPHGLPCRPQPADPRGLVPDGKAAWGGFCS